MTFEKFLPIFKEFYNRTVSSQFDEWGYHYPLTLKFLTEAFQQENSNLSIEIIESYILKVCDKFESYTEKFGHKLHISTASSCNNNKAIIYIYLSSPI